jgi:hypothetical protein
MLKSQKCQLTCSYCLKIYKEPIDLPCDDSICRQHLSERDIVKQNKIKCKKCNGEFQVRDNEFKSNEALKNSIESHSYLSDDEISRKQDLEASIQKFFEFYDQFDQNKTQLESDMFDHFQELRFKIDQHREELKKRIDDIALAMIDQTKKSENEFLQDLKEKFSSFDHLQSLQDKLNGVEETFRNPHLLIETIKQMQRNQEESLNGIQLKLNQMNQAEDHLVATNGFKPNLSLLNQEEQNSLFGSLKLDGCWLNLNSFKGQILTDERQITELIDLCEFSPNDKWSLLYLGTRDGFDSNDFHSKCDGHSNTLTLLKAKGSGFIFGGFTTVSWESPTDHKFKSDPNAFIFSLTNKDNQPVKIKIDPDEHEYAIYCNSEYGPTFGEDDIHIADNSNTTMNSYSDLGWTYKHPQYEEGTIEAQTFLAGTDWFQLDEIEVYQKE